MTGFDIDRAVQDYNGWSEELIGSLSDYQLTLLLECHFVETADLYAACAGLDDAPDDRPDYYRFEFRG